MLHKMTPYAAINFIRKGIGYDDFIEEYADFRKINKEELFDILEELQSIAKNYKTYEEWFLHIEEYTHQLKEQSKERMNIEEGVTLTTMHSSKGLEYRNVFILDAIEGVFLQSATLHHPFGVFFVQPLEADVPDHDPLYGFVGMLPLGAIIGRHTDFLLQFHQGIFLVLGCLESAVDERVDGCAAEAGCRISLYVHLDEHVGLLQVLEVVVLPHEVDELS